MEAISALILASSAVGSPVQFWDLSPFVQIILDAGVAGLGVVAFTVGWIVPRHTFQAAKEEAAQWKALYEHEQESHEKTREALIVNTQRVEAGVEAARTTQMLVEALRAAGSKRS